MKVTKATVKRQGEPAKTVTSTSMGSNRTGRGRGRGSRRAAGLCPCINAIEQIKG